MLDVERVAPKDLLVSYGAAAGPSAVDRAMQLGAFLWELRRKRSGFFLHELVMKLLGFGCCIQCCLGSDRSLISFASSHGVMRCEFQFDGVYAMASMTAMARDCSASAQTNCFMGAAG